MNADLAAAVATLNAGGFVAYPTETCYGLGAAAADEAAVLRLRFFKGKDGQAPMSLLIADASWALDIADTLSTAEQRLIAAFWPGPLTLLVRPKAGSPYAHLAAPLLGLRCSSHPVAQELAHRFGRPLTSTSANFHGSGLLRDEASVRAVFTPHGIPILGDPQPPVQASESSVAFVDEEGRLVVRREGRLSQAELLRALAP